MTDLTSRRVGSTTDALSWLRSALWAPDVEVAFAAGAAGSRLFIAEPDAVTPELLVPAHPPRAAARVALRSSDARSVPGRLRSAAAAVVSRTGVLPRLVPGRLLSLRLGVGSGDPERSLPAWLAQRLEQPSVLFAVTMGAERYNRKPVLTLFDTEGRLLAFAKVGVDSITDAMVANEAHWLSVMDGARPTAFDAPAVIASASWRDHPVLVTEPVRPPLVPVRAGIERPPDGLVEAIASVDPAGVVAAEVSTPVQEARRSTDERLLLAAQRVVDRHGSTGVSVGAWHGDLSPWNMASRRGRTPLVWDWEAAAPERPIGADVLHSLVMVATHLRDASPTAAISTLRADQLGGLQPDAPARSAALDLHLLDVARRDLELIAQGVDPDLLPGIGAAALDRLVSS